MSSKESDALRKNQELTRERLAFYNRVMGYSHSPKIHKKPIKAGKKGKK